MSPDVPIQSPTVREISKRRISYPSSSGEVNINAVVWEPVFDDEDDRPEGIVQIAHGMVEYIDRYDWYARQLAAKGYVVAGNDHMGHGDSVNSEDDWGYIPMEDGDEILVEDIHRLRHDMQGEYGEDIPYFIQGHSMGSFIVRLYISEYGDGISGAIIEGTGNPSSASSALGRGIATIISKFKGDRCRSGLVDGIVLGGYKNSVPNHKHDNDWLTRDESVVERYESDPKCTFVFTVAGYHTLLELTGQVVDEDVIAKVPKSLPILIASGTADPVGGKNGAGPRQVYQDYKLAGIEDVELKLYEGARHELHNELNKEEFVSDVLAWLEEHQEASYSA